MKALAAVAIILVAVAVAVYFYCPCSRVPGGYLLGDEALAPTTDWSFANGVPLCQVEVDTGLSHSVNLNCMSTEGRLYLSCASCEGKRWSSAALENPSARLRIGDVVYPVTLARVTDAAELDVAWRARAEKTGAPADMPRPDHWWSFRATSRPSDPT
jgi:hypothetical protein